MRSESPADWSKLDRIRFLLDNWDVIFDPNVTSPFGGSDGGGPALMPLMSRHHSVLELNRCLNMLLSVAPGDYRHLKVFRCGVESRIVWETTKIRGPHGKMILSEPKPRKVAIVPAWIDKQRVHAGEAFLEAKFRGDVDIPSELWHPLTCPGCKSCRPDLFAVAA